MSVPIHKSDGIFPFSFDFIKNAAVFTGTVGYSYGDFYRVNIPTHRIFVVTDPNILHHVLVSNESKYEKSRIYWKELKKIIGNGLGSLEGDEWLFLRNFQKPFYTKSVVSTYLDDIIEINYHFLNSWNSYIQNNQSFDAIHHFAELNTSIILKTIFGTNAIEECSEIAKYIADGEATIAWRSKYPWRPYLAWLTGANQRAKKYLNYFNQFTEQCIQNRKKAKDSNFTLLDKFINHLTYNELDRFTPIDIRNEFIVHLGAGTETAAVAKAWILYLLKMNPEVFLKIRNEIDQVIGNERIKIEHLADLVYTKQVIEEGMRLFPPSHAIVRDCIREDEINGEKIKIGDTMYISVYGLHRNPRYWDAPDDFIPERFSPDNEEHINRKVYIPFGAGKHHCIGRYLAMPMLQITIALFCKHFDFEVLGEIHKVPISLSTLKPENGMNFKLKTHEN